MTRRFDSREAAIFFAATVVLALASWPVSFNLGAYGEVFYTSALTIWIASLAALFAGIIIGKTEDDEAYFTWWGCILLLIPTLSLTSVLWSETAPILVPVLDWGILLSLPYIAYVLLMVSAQEALELNDKRLIVWLAIGFICLNSLSYMAGVFNYIFLTCDDFVIAGDEAPASCWNNQSVQKSQNGHSP